MPMNTPVIPLTNMSTVVATVLLRFAYCRLCRPLVRAAGSVSSRNGLTDSISPEQVGRHKRETPCSKPERGFY